MAGIPYSVFVCVRFGAAMEDVDPEQQEPFPVDRDGKPFRAGVDRPDGDRKVGCCDRFQESISRWMLPEDARSKYLERANCFPPPIFIILISIAEVAHEFRTQVRFALGCPLSPSSLSPWFLFRARTDPSRSRWGSALCVSFLRPVVGVYLLRRVEAAEAVGDVG